MTLAHAEATLLEDFMELLGDNEQINPFSRLSRCRGRVQPVGRRLHLLLEAALAHPADFMSDWWGSGGQLTGLRGSASWLVLSYYAPDGRILLRLWPAIKQGEKDIFYSDTSRLDRLAAANGTRSSGHHTIHVDWSLELKPPRFDVHTVTLAEAGTDLRAELATIAGLADCLNTRVPRRRVAEHLKAFVDARLITEDVVSDAVAEINETNFADWKVVAPAHVYCAWPLEDAVRLDAPNDRSNPFAIEIREAAEHLTALVGASLP